MANTSNKGSANTALGGTLEAAFCGKKPAAKASPSAKPRSSIVPAEPDLPEGR